jgi:hypothetical protein
LLRSITRHPLQEFGHGWQAGNALGSPLPNAPVESPSGGQLIPFRRATTERVGILPAENSVVDTTAEQPIQRTIEGSGYLYGILLRVVTTTSANAAATAYFEDAPFSALSSVILEDVNAQLVNVQGYDLYLANLIDRQYAVRFQDQSTNTNLYQLVSGGGGTGGSYTMILRLPVGTNRRDLRGIMGNQDRAQKYFLRTNIASHAASATGPVYTTGPTALGSTTIEKYYENYSVPNPKSPTDSPQQQIPADFGTIHYLTSTLADAIPLGGSQVNHYLRRIGNTIRWVAFVARSNNTRATAETNFPTNIQFKVGEDTLFNESWNYRKALFYERFGFDAPNGVVVYDALHDFAAAAGFEVGDDYYHTQALVNAQAIITWPAGFGSTANSLKFLTDDLQYVEPSAGVAVSA